MAFPNRGPAALSAWPLSVSAFCDVELSAILKAAEDIDETTAGVAWFMGRAGLRIGEAVGIQSRDLDLAASTLDVRRTLNRDGGAKVLKHRKREDQGRTTPLAHDLEQRLMRHLESTGATDINGYLFTSPEGAPIWTGNWRRRVWAPIVAAAGVDAVPHDLRHATATRLIRDDRWSPSEVQQFMGHRDPRITLAIYAHVTTADLPKPSSLAG